jgi:hypothetical protein
MPLVIVLRSERNQIPHLLIHMLSQEEREVTVSAILSKKHVYIYASY